MTRWGARDIMWCTSDRGIGTSGDRGHTSSGMVRVAGVSSIFATGPGAAYMAKKLSDIFEITCPCCAAVLKVDAAVEAVIAHTPPPTKRMFNDMEEAAKAMHQQDDRRESLFRQSVEAEKNKAQLMEKKFAEAVKRAKETPDEKFIRDIDLD